MTHLTIPSMYSGYVWAVLCPFFLVPLWTSVSVLPRLFSLFLSIYVLQFQSDLAIFWGLFFPVIFNDLLLTLFAFQLHRFPLMYQDYVLSSYAINLHPLQ